MAMLMGYMVKSEQFEAVVGVSRRSADDTQMMEATITAKSFCHEIECRFCMRKP